MLSVKERLRKKIQDKKQVEEELKTYQASEHEPIIYMVANQSSNWDNIHSQEAEQDHNIIQAWRMLKMEQQIHQRIEDAKKKGPEKLESILEQLWVNVSDDMIKSALRSSAFIESADRPEFKDARIMKMHTHNIILLQSSPFNLTHLIIQYHALCWLYKYGKDDAGRDFIVQERAYECFLSMMIGLEFLEVLHQHPEMKDKKHRLTTDILLVTNNKFTFNITYPTDDDMRRASQYIELYAFWSRLPLNIYEI